jgi:hypothetical protein
MVILRYVCCWAAWQHGRQTLGDVEDTTRPQELTFSGAVGCKPGEGGVCERQLASARACRPVYNFIRALKDADKRRTHFKSPIHRNRRFKLNAVCVQCCFVLRDMVTRFYSFNYSVSTLRLSSSLLVFWVTAGERCVWPVMFDDTSRSCDSGPQGGPSPIFP